MKPKRILTLIIAMTVMLSLLPFGTAVYADGAVTYLDAVWNDQTKQVDVTTKTLTEAYTLVESGTTAWSNGWYVATNDVSIGSRIGIAGTVHLILCDGVTLTASSGINLTSGNALYIYAQSENADTMGKLNATSPKYFAGIGGGQHASGGETTINGGNITATGNNVSLKTYTLDGVTSQKLISDIGDVSYGINDVYTLDTNKLYVYLPSSSNITSVTMADGQILKPKKDGDTAMYCTHAKTNGDYCDYCGGYLKTSEPTTADGVYQLSSLEELVWFADYVKCENTAAKAVLTADINTLSAQNCKIGTSDKPYAGTFDGNGHKITISISGSDYSALFPYVNGATIKNLNLGGTVAASGQFASGLAGYSSGKTKLENCMSFVTINSSVNGDGNHGGLVANSASGSLAINNCAFMGAIKGENTTNCGGLVGWAAVNVNIINSYVAANFSINDGNDSSNTIARNTSKVNISNCYYTNSLGYDETNAEYVSDEEVTNGELAYKLNGSVSGVDRWYQNIDNGNTDEYPVPNKTHGVVYYGYVNCDAESTISTNTFTKKVIKGRNGGMPTCISPGYCVDCGETYLDIDPNTHAAEETYHKLIDNSKHGEYHSCCHVLIKEENHHEIAATCTGVTKCDICNGSYGSKNAENHAGELKWVDTGYGEHEHKYTCCGVVTDTQAHSLVYEVNDDTDTIGVKCTVCTDDSTDKRNSGHGTVTMSVDDKEYDGKAATATYKATGFMQYWSRPAQITFEYCCEGGCKTSGTHTVKMHVGEAEVTKTFTITQKKLTITQVRAFNKAYDMTNEVFVNTIDLDGIVVYKAADNSSPLEIKDNVEIDLSRAVVTVADSIPGSYDTANITNITLTGADKDNYSIADTVEGVKINDGSDDYKIWNIQISITPSDQTLYGDNTEIDQTAYTVDGLDDIYTLSGEFLYEENGKIKVDTDEIKITYGNTEVQGYFNITGYTGNVVRYCANHYFNENGFCATGGCDSLEAAILITKENCEEYGFEEYEINDDKKYAICNGGQLYWFAQQVNDYGKYEIGGVLADDITVNEDLTAENPRKWTPIGTDSMSSYCGSFYGNGHTVSGLYCKSENGYVGFFGSLGYYTIDNLHIAKSYFEGGYVGGIAGYSGGATINKCSVANDVTVIGASNAGGLLGSDGGYGTIENCFALANVSGGTSGGLVGQNTATIKNCFTDAMQPVGHNSYGGKFDNVFYAEDTRDYKTPDANGYVPVKPTFGDATEVKDFANGEIAYLLQSGVKGEFLGYDENNDWEPIYGEAPQIWGQNIGTDKYPAFSDAKVYEDTYNDVKAYRNEIDGYKIIYVDKTDATVVLEKMGTYTIVLADYEENKLVNAKAFTVTVDKAQAVRIILDDLTLGTKDKVMLLKDTKAIAPLCSAYEVK